MQNCDEGPRRPSAGGQSACELAVVAVTGGRAAVARIQLAVEQIPESSRGKKARVRVTLHERVDLQLSVVEDAPRRRLQVEVDRLTHSRIEAHLQPTIR